MEGGATTITTETTSDQTTANERPQHSSTQVDENIIPDKNIILSLSDKFHHNVIGFIGKNEM